MNKMTISKITHEGMTSLNLTAEDADALGYPKDVIEAALKATSLGEPIDQLIAAIVSANDFGALRKSVQNMAEQMKSGADT
jgi:hypothetical protein